MSVADDSDSVSSKSSGAPTHRHMTLKRNMTMTKNMKVSLQSVNDYHSKSTKRIGELTVKNGGAITGGAVACGGTEVGGCRKAQKDIVQEMEDSL